MERILPILILAMLSSQPTVAARRQVRDTRDARATLRGVKEFAVVVDLNPELEKTGLDKDQLQTDVELRLRKAGIRVVSSGKAFLAINVNEFSGPDQTGLYVFSVKAEFIQPVNLVRNPDFSIFAGTWSLSLDSLAGIARVEGGVRSHAADLVDRFTNAYLAENR